MDNTTRPVLYIKAYFDHMYLSFHIRNFTRPLGCVVVGREGT